MKMISEDDDEKVSANETEGTDSADDNLAEITGTATSDSTNGSADQVPDDPDEAIAWLERLAARQGAAAEELPTLASAVPESLSEPEADDRLTLDGMDAGQIPEDPDEAMAWLEMLAAKEVANSHPVGAAPSDESETVSSAEVESASPEKPTAEVLSMDLNEALDGSLPSGLDEALGWLEELTIEHDEVEEAVAPLETPTVDEESLMAAAALDIDEMAAAEESLVAESGLDEVTETSDQPADDLQFDESEDAMAWLEMLAARQGAPIEELTTIESASTSELQDAGLEEAIELDEVDQSILEAVETPDTSSEWEMAEITESDDEQLSSAIAVDLGPDSGVLGDGEQVEAFESASEDDVAETVLEELTLASQAELDVSDEIDTPMEDLAWLETLGAVDAEKWLEAEEAEQEMESAAAVEPIVASSQPAGKGEPHEVPGALFDISPDGPGSGTLTEARQAMDAGQVEESLTNYTALVEQGLFLAFVIDDLEAISGQRGPAAGLQRVLGDAYARNGQLRKALESYRKALANL